MLMESNVPKISVLIPVYNVEKYVERCMISVLNQTMQEGVEVIIVNDCTPDCSMEIIRKTLCAHVKENGMTIRIVEHKTNRGTAATRNTAMSYATGKYTIFIDSDYAFAGDRYRNCPKVCTSRNRYEFSRLGVYA